MGWIRNLIGIGILATIVLFYLYNDQFHEFANGTFKAIVNGIEDFEF